MSNRLYLRSVNAQGYGEAVKADDYPELVAELTDHDLMLNQDNIVSWEHDVKSLPVSFLIHPGYAKKIGVGNWITEWEEGYEIQTQINGNWVIVNKYQYDKHGVDYRRIILIEPQTTEPGEQPQPIDKGGSGEDFFLEIMNQNPYDGDKSHAENRLADIKAGYYATPAVQSNDKEIASLASEHRLMQRTLMNITGLGFQSPIDELCRAATPSHQVVGQYG